MSFFPFVLRKNFERSRFVRSEITNLIFKLFQNTSLRVDI